MGQMSAGEEPINPPEKLSSEHDLSQFHCGEPTLDDWLRRRALQNEERSASRTYVVCVRKRVVGYYALAAAPASACQRSHLLGRARHMARERRGEFDAICRTRYR